MTTVINLKTGEEYEYTLPPRQAVLVAWFQHTKKDYNWWDYSIRRKPLIINGKFSWLCDDWCALKRKTNEG